ncbi:MAG: hypothetical protein J0M12_06525 [Deltaproteobacteria bacterium]|nr:hypothetical protein [Deltaproteobacteria bacterium]
MSSLTKVVLPKASSAIGVCTVPAVVFWAEKPSAETRDAVAILRAFIAGQYSFALQDIKDASALANSGWELRRFVRFDVLGIPMILAELSHPTLQAQPLEWWETQLIPDLKKKFRVGEIEDADDEAP